MENELTQQEEKRPTFLVVLCILTFINTGLNILTSLVQLISGPTSDEQLLAERVELTKATNEMKDSGMDALAGVMDQMQAMTADIQANFYIAMTVALVAPLLGLFGALKMWRGERLGFHLYIIYNLIAVGGIYLYVSPQNIPSIAIIFGLLLSGLFVFLYSRNLHWMNK